MLTVSPVPYTVRDYGRMIADDARREAYVEALRRVVRPSSVVVDLGAGTGFFSLVALALGARRVHAIEPNPAVRILPALARANGLADRLVVHEAPSSAVSLPERADVIVSDLRGQLPLYGAHAEILHDARERLLAPGGVLLPARDDVRVALLASPRVYAHTVGPYAAGYEGLDLGPALAVATSAVHADHGAPILADELVSDAAVAGTVAWGDAPAPFAASAELVATRDALVHGLAVWFDAHVLDGDGEQAPLAYTSGPVGALPRAARVYGRNFFPWPAPRPLMAGQRVTVSLRAHRTADDYAWGWTSASPAWGGDVLRQSTFFGEPSLLR